jgi:hypothetical protein
MCNNFIVGKVLFKMDLVSFLVQFLIYELVPDPRSLFKEVTHSKFSSSIIGIRSNYRSTFFNLPKLAVLEYYLFIFDINKLMIKMIN